jgi:hypothetical protein
MYSFKASSVTQALQFGIEHLLHEGVEETSRNGKVLVAPGPLCIEYTCPRNRVLFSGVRDANPFFHFHESFAWILSGSNDVAFVEYFAKGMRAYSDDGKCAWGGYGHRMRGFFGYDQIELVVDELKKNPTSRRCVLSLWNAWPMAGDYDQNRSMNRDLPNLRDHDLRVAVNGGLDVPCNCMAVVAIRHGKLDLTVTNRSNDLLYGMLGANSVQFSVLLEYLAMRIGASIGRYFQFTANCHAYLDVFPRTKLQAIADECAELLDGAPLPLTGPAIEPGFDEDLANFMQWVRAHIPSGFSESRQPAFKTAFFATVAAPMFTSWCCHKTAQHAQAQAWAEKVAAPDWRKACTEWLLRRRK